MILLIDHFDSFVFNLAHYMMALGHEVKVVRQNAITIEAIKQLEISHIVLSPGPCTPKEAGISIETVKTFAGRIPLLGVCLGHQILGHVFGGKITAALKPLHGKASVLHHSGTGLFNGIRSPCRVGRYHSLIVSEEGLSKDIEIIARSEEKEVMAFVSTTWCLAGVQFHPESVLTDDGHQLLQNFLDGTFL